MIEAAEKADLTGITRAGCRQPRLIDTIMDHFRLVVFREKIPALAEVLVIMTDQNGDIDLMIHPSFSENSCLTLSPVFVEKMVPANGVDSWHRKAAREATAKKGGATAMKVNQLRLEF